MLTWKRADLLVDTDPIALRDEAMESIDALCRIIRQLHPDDAPDPLTLRLVRDALGEGTTRLFCAVIAEGAGSR